MSVLHPANWSCVRLWPLMQASSDYFNSLKQIDIEFMKQLHTKVNLIPVIAKADTMTDEEIVDFKQRVCISQT